MNLRSLAIVGAVATILLSACGWTQQDFDGGHSRANELETALTAANVGSLERHTVTVPNAKIVEAFTLANWLVLATTVGTVAYDRHTCPRADNGPCTPVWTRPEPFRSSNGRVMFFSTGGTGFIATDMTGTTLWTGIPTPPDGAVNPYFAAEAFTISGSSMLLTVDAYVGHGSTASTMNVFPIDGCGAPQCAPARTIDPTSNTDGSGRWSASGNVVLRRSGGLTAWDLTTGAALWSTAAPQRTPVRTRDARVFASTTTGTDVFDATGVAGCAGAPKICAPLAHFAAPDISAASDHVAVALAENPDNKVAVQLFPADPGACPTAPTPCAPFATTNLIGPVSGYHSVAITRNLVFVATDILGFFTETPHLFAFDAAGVANCAGSPDICSPLVDLIMPEGAGSGQITVWDGRVYVPGSDGALNVFGLPGDVS